MGGNEEEVEGKNLPTYYYWEQLLNHRQSTSSVTDYLARFEVRNLGAKLRKSLSLQSVGSSMV